MKFRDLVGIAVAASLLALAVRTFSRHDDLRLAISVEAFMYAAKFFLNRRYPPLADSVFAYSICFGVAVACIDATTWNNPDASTTCNLFMVPVMLLTVPTATFILDVRSVQISSSHFVLRSLAEICVVIPIWYVACAFFAVTNGMINI